MRKKIRQLKNHWLFSLIFVLILLGLWLLGRGYFNSGSGLEVVRLEQMKSCFADGQIPCRWSSNWGEGFGYPLFNYLPPFSYYLGIVFTLFNLGSMVIIKILLFSSILLTGFFTYLLLKEFLGKKAGAIISFLVVFLIHGIFAFYPRFGLSGVWGLTFLPLLLWSIYKGIKNSSFNFILVSIFSLFFLLISHQALSLFFLPLLFCWGAFWVFLGKKKEKLFNLLLVFAWSLGLSAFFTLPAYFGKSLLSNSFLVDRMAEKGIFLTEPRTIAGEVKIIDSSKRSNFWHFTSDSVGGESAIVEVPVVDHLPWEVYLDGELVIHWVNDKSGLVNVSLPVGRHIVVGWLRSTLLQKIANGITLLSFFSLFLLIAKKEQKKEGK